MSDEHVMACNVRLELLNAAHVCQTVHALYDLNMLHANNMYYHTT